MKTLLVTVDYNDADYISGIVTLEDQDYERFLPVIEAINNFKPYITEWGPQYSNWESCRPDLVDKSIYEVYHEFSIELLDEFNEKITGKLNNPESDYGSFHSIINIQEVTLGKRLVYGEYEYVKERGKERIEAYNKEYARLMGYKRAKDGMPLNSIPFNEMTPEETKLLEEADNLWKKYQ